MSDELLDRIASAELRGQRRPARGPFSVALGSASFFNPQPNNTMFHSRNGLFFCRLNDTGEVRIIKTRDGKMPDPDTNPPEWAITLPENEWASVVCSVSADGETSARWMRARRFHGTDLPYGEHELKNATQEELTPEQKEWMKADLS